MPSASPEKNRRDVARFRKKMAEKGYQQVNAWIRRELKITLLKKTNDEEE